MSFLCLFIFLGFSLLMLTLAHYVVTEAVPWPPRFFCGRGESDPKPSMSFSLDPNYFPVLKRAHPADAGLDIGVVTNTTIDPYSIMTVDTGVRVAVPKGYVGFLFLRSSFASNHPTLRLLNNVGVIDSGYTGNIKAVFENTGEAPVMIYRGERFAQLVVVPCLLDTPQFVRRLQDTERGEGGFGSTGK